MRWFLLIILIYAAEELGAAHFRENNWLAEEGVLESLSLEPRLPAQGEAFRVRVAGSWPDKNADGTCYGPLDFDSVRVLEGNMVQIGSNPQHDPAYCGQEPARWEFEVDVPASAWSAVDEEGFLRVEHFLFSGINMITGINQRFDMRLGTHEVPAFLGSGFWVSEALPFEGLMIEQQGQRVMFYGLSYDRNPLAGDEGEPVWQMVVGRMEGNSTLGRSSRFDWPFDSNSLPEESPAYEELLTVNDSGAIIVLDYNRVRAFTRLEGGIFGRYETYRRLAFGEDPGRLPVFVPPLAGRWILHGFDGQSESLRSTVALLEGQPAGPGQYLFSTAEDKGSVLCTMETDGSGECTLAWPNESMQFEFPLAGFNGNLARGVVKAPGGQSLDGVLVREPWRLPVLEVVP